jgi:multidrug efflux system membrane fusion protein
MKASPKSLRTLGVLLAGIAATVACLSGCGKQPEKPVAGAAGGAPKGRPPVPVLTAVAEQADVPIELRMLGTVEPIQSSPVRSQVAGTIVAVGFREGDLVTAGQMLFKIDPRPIEATIRQLQANLLRDRAQIFSAEAQTLNAEAQVRNAEAQLKNAEAQAKRYEDLMAKDLIAREQYDQRATALDAARAALDAARAVALASRSAQDVTRANLEATQAALENAKLQLEYTVIPAPVSGQAGNLLLEKGDLVKVNDTILVVVNQIQPILVRFSVPEPRLPEVQSARVAGALTVRVVPAGAGAAPREGRVVFLDNAVDRTTGTIALKAQVDNRDRIFWPGQFIDVTLVLATLKNAVVVPSPALQTGQQGAYVFVVDAAGAAAVRPVTPGPTVAGRTVVAQGLAAGETVVTDGQLRLTPGATVVRKTSLTSPPAGGGSPGKTAPVPNGGAAPSPEKPR